MKQNETILRVRYKDTDQMVSFIMPIIYLVRGGTVRVDASS